MHDRGHELLGPGAEGVGETVQGGGAFAGRHPRPRPVVEGSAGRRDGPVNLFPGGPAELGDRLLPGRINDHERLAGAADDRAVDGEVADDPVCLNGGHGDAGHWTTSGSTVGLTPGGCLPRILTSVIVNDSTESVTYSGLERWLDERGLGAGPVVLEPLGEGHSNPTFLLVRGELRLVLRRAPDGPLAPSTHDVLREAAWMQALAPSRVPVPKVVATSADETVVGSPFFVMELLEGSFPRPRPCPTSLRIRSAAGLSPRALWMRSSICTTNR